ncbi:hypothetical protein SDRG_08330 [Saprolegnia diclina VS20]|uniref:Uncharacterized protein n=1 Tax=Saprolegnia diclina (strain VS20) TaxID=1156394 RepID=T0QHA1_SAPDV|nr:hypothetical protein SDRG_08330 [Saprolegnia diclina VS20]EQC34121.1 hypothetical protein SDRG_08330 [Saprolegnia diclina VS20]|eukprot:XP_008612433.1 hypothetical protein SDRG_08330 [Saprolegnia diclina VS20]
MDPVVSPSQRCAYKSGKCTNARTRKLNGGQHSLCAVHREKQNAHQRKSDRKARQRKVMQLAADPFVSSTPFMQMITHMPKAYDAISSPGVPVVKYEPYWTSHVGDQDQQHQHIDVWWTHRRATIVPTSAIAVYSEFPESQYSDAWLSSDEIKPQAQPVRLPSIRELLHPVYARDLFPSHTAA